VDKNVKDRIMKLIEEAYHPDNMTAKEALEFLEDIQSRIEGAIDRIKGRYNQRRSLSRNARR
jgi:ABC-type multidrug transport system ATPase subunit